MSPGQSPIDRRALLAAVPLGLFASSCPRRAGAQRGGVTAAAAASVADVVEAVATAWSAAWPAAPARVVAGSTSGLVQQLGRGAPYDVLVCASEDWMDRAVERGLVEVRSRVELARNALVLVAPDGDEARLDGGDLSALAGVRWTTGDPAHVPLGQYAREALERAGAWAAAAPTLVPASDARAALRLVERGEVDGALIYRSDASASQRVRIALHVPPGLHAPIVYSGAVAAGADDEAREFLAMLVGPTGAARFSARGFDVAEGPR